MRRVIWSVMTTLDGIFDGPGEDYERIAWCRADQEWLDYSVELLDAAGVLLFGRRTYEGMAAYWPEQTDPVAQLMNRLDKIVFSRTLQSVTWNHTRLSRDPVTEVSALREGDGGNILLLGSANLADSLRIHGLIDEYRLAVNPVVLGAGTPAFKPGRGQFDLERRDARVFDSGVVEFRCTPR